MIHVTTCGTVSYGSTEDLQHIRLEFDRQHHIRLPQFFDASLLALVQRRINNAEFYERVDEDIATESCMKDNLTAGIMGILMNSTTLFRFIEEITGCTRIGSFTGRLFRLMPGIHCDSWHSDRGDDRLIAISLNLSTAPYRGGVLQIRNRESRRIVSEVANTGYGDAIIFRIDAGLEHRVTEVVGKIARTTFAGWFRSQSENYLYSLQKNDFTTVQDIFDFD